MSTSVRTSRTEIAEHVRPAFQDGPASKADLLATADRNGAPEAVVSELHRLSDRSYPELRALWPELPGLPVEVS